MQVILSRIVEISINCYVAIPHARWTGIGCHSSKNNKMMLKSPQASSLQDLKSLTSCLPDYDF